ncbi:DNA topoisomerase IB [Flavobacterium sp.]
MERLKLKLEKIGRDPKVTAKSVGLRYSSDNGKGFYRTKIKTSFIFYDENKNKVKDSTILERINKLVIPPAWENVWISPHENGHLQVTGIDAKGRKQYRYHVHWNKIRNQSKFYRLRRFAKVLPLIRKQVDTDLKKKGLPYEKVVALAIKIIEMTNIRSGNDSYRKLYGSIGLTTMQDKHVKFTHNKVFFEFTGKKGVPHKLSITSVKLANLIKKCKDIPGQDLFQYYDDNGHRHSITSTDINAYLKNSTQDDFTAKDFRCWAGSVNALLAFQKLPPPTTETEMKKKVVEVLDEVASKLGNTRTVCKKYYVHPTVISSFEKGSIWKYTAKHQNSKLSKEENSLYKLLEKETIAQVHA